MRRNQRTRLLSLILAAALLLSLGRLWGNADARRRSGPPRGDRVSAGALLSGGGDPFAGERRICGGELRRRGEAVLPAGG